MLISEDPHLLNFSKIKLYLLNPLYYYMFVCGGIHK